MSTDEKSPGRSNATKAIIITTAEQLFAEQSVAAVSINTVNTAAQQKNRNAVHYHFGGKDGLLQAIFDKHTPAIHDRRQLMLDRAMADSQPKAASLRQLVEALVIPVAEKLADQDGGEAFLRISAELAASNTLDYYQPSAKPLRLNREDTLAQLIIEQLPDLPQAIVEQRMMLVVGLLFHGLADHSQVKRSAEGQGPLSNTELMVANLVDSIVAILSNPISNRTQALLG